MTDERPPQKQLAGRFAIREYIDDGGFATVFRAHDSKTDDEVAVKIPRNDVHADAEVTARFDREIRSLAGLQTAVIPTSIGRFIDGSTNQPRYIVTEYIDGESLTKEMVTQEVSPGMNTVIAFGFPVLRALEFLHFNRYLYLDCKPKNILLRDEGGSVLIDFNTVVRESATEPADFYADPFKPPEQTPEADAEHARTVGPWSDVYAAGKLLCYLLTDKTVPPADTPNAGIDPRNLGSTCPVEVAVEVQRATKADPDQRHDDAIALVDALLRVRNEPTATGVVTHRETDTVCPVRPGDTVGRVTDTASDTGVPALSIHDPERYVSPQHFRLYQEAGAWFIEDTSLNGTFVREGDEWTYLLSPDGYQRQHQHENARAGDIEPPSALRIDGSRLISPIDPGYSVTLEFDPTGVAARRG